MSWLTDMLAEAGAQLSHVEHMALQLLHAVANGQVTLAELSKDHPLVAEAIMLGTAAATAHGIPVVTLEDQVIAEAKRLDGLFSESPATA